MAGRNLTGSTLPSGGKGDEEDHKIVGNPSNLTATTEPEHDSYEWGRTKDSSKVQPSKGRRSFPGGSWISAASNFAQGGGRLKRSP